MWFGGEGGICGGSLEGLTDELGPVADGAGQHAAVDEVEFVDKGPVFLEVVDEELDIGGDAELCQFGLIFEAESGLAHKAG